MNTTSMNTLSTRLQRALLVGSPLWLSALSLGGTIHHGDLGAGTRVHEAEVPGCEQLPQDAPLIPTLRTGWAQMRSGKLHVMLSDTPMRCPDAALTSTDGVPACGASMWTLDYDLPEEMQAVGLYDLTQHVVNWDLRQQSADDAGGGCTSACATMSVGASFNPGGQGPEGQLEVLGINDGCITGRIMGLDQSGQLAPPPPELNGAFRAVRCD